MQPVYRDPTQTSGQAEQVGMLDSAQDIAAKLRRAQFKSMNEILPQVMTASVLGTVVLYFALRHQVADPALSIWFVLRLMISAARAVYARIGLRALPHLRSRDFTIYATLALLDGVIWGAMGWWLTPLDRLDIAVITLTMSIIVACTGMLGLHVHQPSALGFVLAITLPSAFHALGRQDELGVLCCIALLGLTGLLLIEMRRFNGRFIEMMQLRFESEQTAKAKSEALQQAQELAQTRSRFVATMSHEIRTPLHGMLGLLRLARQEVGQADLHQRLELIQSTGEHLVKVINEVLEHARLESSGLPVYEQPFDITALLRELTEITRPSCEGKGLAFVLKTNLAPGTHVLGDATRVRQILHNLLGNAVKFTSSGSVSLSAHRDTATGHLRMVVQDTGPGVPAAEQERIFEAYHQAEGTYQRRFGGTGLGLTISRELCEAMGGQLTCRSENGQGAEFVCALPLPQVQAGTPASRAAPIASHQAEPQQALGDQHVHVLLVEDNPVNTIVAEAILRKMGVEVTAVEHGEAALAWLETHQADLILMDCEMPGLDGMQVTRQIRLREKMQRLWPTPVIAMTANGHDTYVRHGIPAGMSDYISKPFDEATLRTTMLRQLNNSRTPARCAVT
jgi:signal transduction histidine kinase/ActR/RegA family two-component response regulator